MHINFGSYLIILKDMVMVMVQDLVDQVVAVVGDAFVVVCIFSWIFTEDSFLNIDMFQLELQDKS